jgi:hypothetical protein
VYDWFAATFITRHAIANHVLFQLGQSTGQNVSVCSAVSIRAGNGVAENLSDVVESEYNIANSAQQTIIWDSANACDYIEE